MWKVVRTLTALALLLALSASLPAQGKGKGVKPNREWNGIINDEKLHKESPKGGTITDARTFEKLWTAWKLGKKVPTVDFTKEFVLVMTAGGPNRPGVTAVLDEAGDLKVDAVATLIGGPGFGYAVGTYPRAGVKTVNGKALR